MTEYKVETIGASFSKKDIQNLSTVFTNQAKEGWEFYDAYSIEKQGCLLTGGNTVTYIAVYKRETKPEVEKKVEVEEKKA